MTSSSSTATPFSLGNLWAALAGAGGGLLSFFVGEIVGGLTGGASQNATNLSELVLGSALWSGAIGLIIGAAILIYSNLASLRGQWHRDLLGALPLFFGLGFVGGAAGQLAYTLIQNSLTRGIGWSLMGASIGIGIGLLRRDMIQASRGALGGAIGGFLGGFIFDGLSAFSSGGNGAFSRLVGQIIMGALIALLMRVVQEALKSAWLLGISTGPYEGKEYPLNTPRVTVGREDSNAISLFREREIPAQLGALVFQNQTWMWQGAPILINGAPQNHAILNPGDTLQMGETRFRFQNRSLKAPAPEWAPPIAPPHASPAIYSAPNSFPTPAPNAWPAPAPRTVANPSAAPTASPIPAAPPRPAAPTPAFALMLLSGALLRLPDLTSPVTVGRAAGSGLVLADAGVSSQHARLQWSGGALQITDLSSTNGTHVNGVKLSPQVPQTLRPGDRVRFGPLETTLRAG